MSDEGPVLGGAFFVSIPTVVDTHASIAEVANAIESEGFYTWDRFGRYVRIPPYGGAAEHKKLRERALNELAGYSLVQLEGDRRLMCDFNTLFVHKCGWQPWALPQFDDETGRPHRNESDAFGILRCPNGGRLPTAIEARGSIILQWLEKQGYDPMKLPRSPNGLPGIRAETKRAMLESANGNFTESTFKHAWDALLSSQQVEYADSTH